MRRIGAPSVGRSVHYWPVAAMMQENPQPWHAVIIKIESAPGECQLVVFPPVPRHIVEPAVASHSATCVRRLARFSEEPTGGCWTWPEHVVVPEPEVEEGLDVFPEVEGG